MYDTDFNIQEWKAKKQEERQTAFAVQEEAMQAVFESGQTLTDYFYGRGRLGSHITAGNAAVILETNPLAKAVMAIEEWNKYGRRVNKGAEGISQIARNNGYYSVVKVFDVSQTYGNKPYPIAVLETKEQMAKAVNVLAEICPIPAVMTPDCHEVVYSAEKDEIMLPTTRPPEEVLQWLPAQIVLAVAEHSYEGISENPYMRQTAAAVAVEVCGRLGLPAPSDAAETLAGMKEHIPDGEERRALEKVRELAVTFGDTVCQRLKLERGQPTPQREER